MPWTREPQTEAGDRAVPMRPRGALWLGHAAVLLLRLTVAALLIAPVAALIVFMLR